jgi:anti-sigma regulatory factor (Ser/Thr protein kinase)
MKPVLVIDRSEDEARELRQHVVQSGFDCLPVFSGIPVTGSGDDGCSLILAGGTPAESDFARLLGSLEERFPQIPVVTVTDSGPGGISTREALQSGITGSLPRNTVASELAWTLRTILDSGPDAVANPESADRAGDVICYTIENNPELLPLVVAQVRRRLENWPFPDPMEVLRMTVALGEALDNALYHGNLELSSDLRHGSSGAWRDESLRRRSTAPYRDRTIRFQGMFGEKAARFIIRDEGTGFDPLNQVDCTDSQNRERCSGRGLLLMRLYMDAVQFNPSGNEVTLIKHRPCAES